MLHQKFQFQGTNTADSSPVFTRLPKTSIAPENGWLEDKPFLLEWPDFRGEMLVVISCTWVVLE